MQERLQRARLRQPGATSRKARRIRIFLVHLWPASRNRALLAARHALSFPRRLAIRFCAQRHADSFSDDAASMVPASRRSEQMSCITVSMHMVPMFVLSTLYPEFRQHPEALRRSLLPTTVRSGVHPMQPLERARRSEAHCFQVLSLQRTVCITA